MADNTLSYHMEGDYLVGPEGRFKIQEITSAYSKVGGRMSLKKYLVFAGAVLGTTALWGMGAAPYVFPLIGTAGGGAYMFHETHRVFITIAGTEHEIWGDIYWPGLWREEEAKKRCYALVDYIQECIKHSKSI